MREFFEGEVSDRAAPVQLLSPAKFLLARPCRDPGDTPARRRTLGAVHAAGGLIRCRGQADYPYYRAEVVEVIDTDAIVTMIDEGTVEIIEAQNLFHLPPALVGKPPLALRCSLLGWKEEEHEPISKRRETERKFKRYLEEARPLARFVPSRKISQRDPTFWSKSCWELMYR
ncbi:unnamed protein product [Sphagnum tenellum]